MDIIHRLLSMLPQFLFVAAVLFVFAFFLLRAPLLARFNKLPDDPAGLSFPRRRFPMSASDALPLTAVMLVYAAIAFLGLGDTDAPQSFCKFDSRGRYVDIELSEPMKIDSVMFYSGLHTGEYFLQFSADGENYTDISTMEQHYNDLFKWNTPEFSTNLEGVKYIRILSGSRLDMGELAIYDHTGRLLRLDEMSFNAGVATLFDEQALIPPEGRTYLNSTYFDEIYHARTAYENVENVYPYETTHPPLGKLIISIGIRLFGMTPFGWRFMGTLFGVLMLAFIYIFLKNMFGSTAISVCGTLIFAFDFMHFAQTRIATIDTYAVFFILGMYFFMYRYVSSDPDDPLVPGWRRNFQLFLSGLFFGIGAASKWPVIYGGIGLALIWLIYWIFRGVQLRRCGRGRDFAGQFLASVSLCVVFFILVPAAVYYLSYWPYGTAKGMSGFQMLTNREYLDIVINNQKSMFSYHAGIEATHPYSSRWYQWIVDGRPILYYLGYPAEGFKSAIGAFLNPLLCWGGLVSMVMMGYLSIIKRDGRALFILIGYLSQLVPWVFISRLTFEYHYFPCAVFLTLAVCHIFDMIRRSGRLWRLPVYGYTAACIALFALFYPVLSGAAVPGWYGTYFLRWISDSWPF